MKKNPQQTRAFDQLDAYLLARVPRHRSRILDRVSRRVEHGESIEDAAAIEYLAVVDRLPPGQPARNLALYARRHGNIQGYVNVNITR